nr:GNAT family N-acetyltransferase [Ramlibacter albus]
MHIQFRPVSREDGDALATLRVEAMRESLERAGRFDPERARNRFLDAFSPDATHEIVANGERAGFYVLKWKGASLWLDHLYLKAQWQGRGIGAQVLRHVFARADELQVDVGVGALRGSPANRFYARHGFELVEQVDVDNYYVRRPRR